MNNKLNGILKRVKEEEQKDRQRKQKLLRRKRK